VNASFPEDAIMLPEDSPNMPSPSRSTEFNNNNNRLEGHCLRDLVHASVASVNLPGSVYTQTLDDQSYYDYALLCSYQADCTVFTPDHSTIPKWVNRNARV